MPLSANSSQRMNAIQRARDALSQSPVYLDTETNGLERDAEIVEIAIIDHDGQVLLQSLVRPTQPIPPDASRIHGITDEMVRLAPLWPVIYSQVKSLLDGQLVAIYNVEFDLRMMQQSNARHRRMVRDYFQTIDVMKLYADFRADWDPRRRSNRFYSLDAAGKACRIPLPNAHRAVADTLLTRAVLQYIANAA